MHEGRLEVLAGWGMVDVGNISGLLRRSTWEAGPPHRMHAWMMSNTHNVLLFHGIIMSSSHICPRSGPACCCLTGRCRTGALP